MAHLPCAPTHPNVRLPFYAVAVRSKLLTQASGSGCTWLWVATAEIAPAASAAGPSPRGVQCFTGPAAAVFFAARVTRQPQTTNAIRTARKSPSSRLSAMLFSAFGEGRLSQGRGDSHPLWIDNAFIDATVPSAAVDISTPSRRSWARLRRFKFER